MKRFMGIREILLSMIILALASGCSKNAGGEVSGKLADFTLPDLTGQQVSLRSFEGKKIVVLNIWATWCGPCRYEIPDFNAAYEVYKNRGVEFLGVSVDPSAAEVVPPFLNEIPITYPVLLGTPDLLYRYNIRGLPTTYIIDKDGTVKFRQSGMMDRQALEDELNKLL
jgi:peroxiredoxin